jgi:glycosyltransferase involved in cell wall biosynthesis
LAPVIQHGLIVLLTTAFTIQIIYWLYRFNVIGKYKVTTLSQNNPAVSVIICAKNELENLSAFLESILTQDYTEFEVIICDDFSTDGTKEHIEHLQKKYKNLRYLKPDKDSPGKKYALSYAISKTNFDTILVTDADCRPSSSEWIQEMANNYSGNTNLVLAYGPFQKLKGLLNKFIRFECLFTAIQYMSASILAKPYMGVGRNMMFQKKVFQKYEAQPDKPQIASGDDDLFVNASAKILNSQLTMEKSSFMVSKPKEKLGSFLKQKKRHISTASYYSISSQISLIIYPLSHVIFYFSLVLLLFSPYYIFALSLYFFRLIIQSNTVRKWMNKLDETDLSLYLPLLDFLLGVYYISMFPFIFIKNKNSW